MLATSPSPLCTDRSIVFTRWRPYAPASNSLVRPTRICPSNGVSIGSAVLQGWRSCDQDITQTDHTCSGGYSIAISCFSLVYSFFLSPNFVLPPYSSTLTCNFVNVYTIRYRVHVYTRASLVSLSTFARWQHCKALRWSAHCFASLLRCRVGYTLGFTTHF